VLLYVQARKRQQTDLLRHHKNSAKREETIEKHVITISRTTFDSRRIMRGCEQVNDYLRVGQFFKERELILLQTTD